MKNRLPDFPFRDKVCVICEGNEEYDYLERLKNLGVWNVQYEVSLDNAGGNGNIPARYQDRYQNGSFEVVLVFCDTEKKPYEQYSDIKKKINTFHGVDGAAEEVIIYGNPCTMQIILAHWDDVRLKTAAKKINAPIIEKLTGVTDYRGRADQREEIMRKVTAENYKDMYARVRELPSDDEVVGSSNFERLLDYLSADDDSWMARINSVLEG